MSNKKLVFFEVRFTALETVPPMRPCMVHVYNIQQFKCVIRSKFVDVAVSG